MKTIAFFNNKGGVGKTSMAYHLAWMLRDMGRRALAVDLDPQSPTLRDWRKGWQTRRKGKAPVGLSLPSGQMRPLGYVLLNPSVRENRPVKSYLKWADRIPATYDTAVLGTNETAAALDDDPNRLAMLKHFKSLMPMAQDARKPMFHLTPADGAIGGHAGAVVDCRKQFQALAEVILLRAEESSEIYV